MFYINLRRESLSKQNETQKSKITVKLNFMCRPTSGFPRGYGARAKEVLVFLGAVSESS